MGIEMMSLFRIFMLIRNKLTEQHIGIVITSLAVRLLKTKLDAKVQNGSKIEKGKSTVVFSTDHLFPRSQANPMILTLIRQVLNEGASMLWPNPLEPAQKRPLIDNQTQRPYLLGSISRINRATARGWRCRTNQKQAQHKNFTSKPSGIQTEWYRLH